MGYVLDATTIEWAKQAESELELGAKFARNAVVRMIEALRFLRLSAEAMKDQPQSETVAAYHKALMEVCDDVSEDEDRWLAESRELWDAIREFEKRGAK